jgi:carotenoid cleavage dioxygenase-like enzyme
MAAPLRLPPDAPPGTDDAVAAEDRALLFRSLTREVADVALPVRGRLPAWLSGTLVRNGPALFEIGAQRLSHWFDGQAMLHAFAIADGRVRYTNRFVDGVAYRANRAAGRLRYREFASDPCQTLFGRVKALFVPGGAGGVSDNATIHVTRLGAHHAALTEGALPVASTRARCARSAWWTGTGRRRAARAPRSW